MDEKTVTNWLGLKDFFNYFLPGLIWIADFIFGMLIFAPSSYRDLSETLGRINNIVLVLLTFLIPYFIGILLGFTGNLMHRADKKFLGEPEKYVINPEKKKLLFNKVVGSSLGMSLRESIKPIIQSKLGIKSSSASTFQAVQYSLQFIPFPQVIVHVERITNMMNLYEGLIIPLLVGSLISLSAIFFHFQWWLVLILILLLCFSYGAWFRYHYFRENRAKIIYRYFYLWQTMQDKGLLAKIDNQG